MTRFNHSRVALAALLTVMAAGSAGAADGERLYAEKGCNTCHGPTGEEPIMPTYPRIAGQNKQYLVNQINDIKSGDRDNGASVAMRGIVANLSDDEIVALAEYLSGL